MATTYLAPGVYVEEGPAGRRPIEGVGTSTAAFIGPTPDLTANEVVPTPCNSLDDFVRKFKPDDKAANVLAHAVYGFFMNGGTRCYVCNTGRKGSVTQATLALEAYDEPAMVLAPGATAPEDYEALITHAEKMRDRIAILDGPGPDLIDDVTVLTEVATPASGGDEAEAEGGGRRRPAKGRGKGVRASSYAAFYFPWLKCLDGYNGGGIVDVPPSGHIAGIYAMNDARRGVHKAPANYPIRTVVDLAQYINPAQTEVLNPAGVNVIRFFRSGALSGVRVWGARTRADDPQWRYINVRRLFCATCEALAKGTQWVVFEPNDSFTRSAVKFACECYLKNLWRSGALVGSTPEEAFFVKCDRDNNPDEVVDEGRLCVDIGMAPSKPAEFVVFRIGQWSGGTDVEAAA